MRKGGVGGLGMLLAGYCVLSYIWSYPHISKCVDSSQYCFMLWMDLEVTGCVPGCVFFQSGIVGGSTTKVKGRCLDKRDCVETAAVVGGGFHFYTSFCTG